MGAALCGKHLKHCDAVRPHMATKPSFSSLAVAERNLTSWYRLTLKGNRQTKYKLRSISLQTGLRNTSCKYDTPWKNISGCNFTVANMYLEEVAKLCFFLNKLP